MRHLLKLSAVLGLLLFASSAHAQVGFSLSFGTPPPPPRVYHVAPRPGPEFMWVEGYWYPNGKKYAWHDGYWTRPPYAGAYWVDPYWQGGRYYEGYWGTPRGDYRHDHRWDKDHDRRDYDHHDDHR
jgi:WXXGXW repeat (2 copies)